MYSSLDSTISSMMKQPLPQKPQVKQYKERQVATSMKKNMSRKRLIDFIREQEAIIKTALTYEYPKKFNHQPNLNKRSLDLAGKGSKLSRNRMNSSMNRTDLEISMNRNLEIYVNKSSLMTRNHLESTPTCESLNKFSINTVSKKSPYTSKMKIASSQNRNYENDFTATVNNFMNTRKQQQKKEIK